jgi:hypothetical protein
MSGCAVVFVRFGLTNSTKVLSFHADMGGKFTQHRIIASEGQKPRNNEYPIFVLAIPDFDAIGLHLPVEVDQSEDANYCP